MDFCNLVLIEAKSAVKKQGVKSDFDTSKGRLSSAKGEEATFNHYGRFQMNISVCK